MQLELQDIEFRHFARHLVKGEIDMFNNDQETADRLYNEFQDILSSGQTNHLVILETRLLKQYKRHDESLIIVEALKVAYTKELADIARGYLGYGLQFSEESYLADIETVEKLTNTQRIKIKQLQDEKEKAMESFKGESMNFNTLTRTTLAICKDLGYSLPADVDTRTWAVARKEYTDKLEKLQKDGKRSS